MASWREAKGLWPGRLRPKRRREGSYAHLRGLDQLYGPRNTKCQADHRADRPRRRDRRETRAEVGAGLWTVGPYDMVAVFEAPDDEAMSAHLLEISSSMGTIRTTTLRAYDEQEMSGILQRIG